MTRKFIFNAVPFLVAAILFSCKKNDADPAQGNNTRIKVKSFIEDVNTTLYHRVDTFNISYDSDDRIISMISSKAGQFFYSYNGNTNYTMDIMDDSHLIIREVSYINSNLLADSTFYYNDTNDSGSSKTTYNSGGQSVQYKMYDYYTTRGFVLRDIDDYTYDPNGNLIKATTKDTLGKITSTRTYTYTDLMPALPLLTPKYTPIPYKRLPASVSTFHTSGGSTDILNYQYTVDNKNRLNTQTRSDTHGNSVTDTYFYY